MGENSYINWPGPIKTLPGAKGQNSCMLGSQKHSRATDPLAGIPVPRMLLPLSITVPWTWRLEILELTKVPCNYFCPNASFLGGGENQWKTSRFYVSELNMFPFSH